MAKQLPLQIDGLKQKILFVGALVEEAIAKAISALNNRDRNLANAVIEADAEIDRMEVDVEEECLKVLALYQPVAADLRFVVAVLKMNNDLERMGDLAKNIAKRVVFWPIASGLSCRSTTVPWPSGPRVWSRTASTRWSTPTRNWPRRCARATTRSTTK